MTHQVRACALEPTPAAVMRTVMTPDSVARWLSRAYRLIRERLARDDVAVTGLPFACFTVNGDRVEVEAGYPVSSAVAGDGMVMTSGLPGGPAAVTLYEGPPESLDVVYPRIELWLAGHGFTVRGRHWVRYLVDDIRSEGDPSRWRTEVVVPYGWDRWVPIVQHRDDTGADRHDPGPSQPGFRDRAVLRT